MGRDGELEHLYDGLGKAIIGNGGLFLISGEAGIGKTRILRRLCETAAKSGFLSMAGECVPGIPLPYLPFQEALSYFSGGPFSPENLGNPLAPKEQASILFDTLELLTNESAKRPLLLCLEDLHWADSASTQLLHFLARNVSKLRVMIVGTYRPEDLASSSDGEMHPLQSTIPLMSREGIMIEISLGRISEDELFKAIDGMMGGPTEPNLKRSIFQHSGGNPLFAVEIIRMLVSELRLVQYDGIWTLAEGNEIKIPRTVKDVIKRRIDQLSRDQMRILECASVIGETFDPSLISESIGVDELSLLDELDTMFNNFQLVAGQEEDFSFTHAMIRDVIYGAISKPKRIELHRRVGTSLEGRLPDDSLLANLSWHFDQANDGGKCIKYSLLSGKYSLRRSSRREAKAFFQLVLARTEDDQSHVAERLEALEGLGDLNVSQSTPREWYSYYEQFLELNHDDKARARVLAKAGECWDQLGLADVKKANDLLDEAENLAEGDPRILADIEFHRGEMSFNDGYLIVALGHFANSRRYYEEVGDSKGIVHCGVGELITLLQDNQIKEAKTAAEILLPIVLESKDLLLILMIKGIIADINGMVGKAELAKKVASEIIQQAEMLGLMGVWRFALRVRAEALELEGDLESARIDLIRSLENAREFDLPIHIAVNQIALARCEFEIGHMSDAERNYEEVDKVMIKLMHTVAWELQSTYLSILRADLLAAKDDILGSDEIYDWLIRSHDETGRWFELVESRSRYGMSLAKRGVKEKARFQFDEASNVAVRIGCERRVQLMAKRVGMDL